MASSMNMDGMSSTSKTVASSMASMSMDAMSSASKTIASSMASMSMDAMSSASKTIASVSYTHLDVYKRQLFNPLLISKEIYAIQSEHEGNISSTTKIFYHAARILANPNHPFSRFSTGNIHSLSSIPQLKKIKLKSSLNTYFGNNFFGENITSVSYTHLNVSKRRNFLRN